LALKDKYYLDNQNNYNGNTNNSRHIYQNIQSKNSMTEDYITHFINNGQKVPIWALIKALSFNEIESCLKLFKQSSDTKDILVEMLNHKHNARTTSHIRFIHAIRKMRNICAHYDRLIGQKIAIPNIDNINSKYTSSFFGGVYILGEYYLSDEMLKDMVYRIDSILKENKRFINKKFCNINSFLDEYKNSNIYSKSIGCRKLSFTLMFYLKKVFCRIGLQNR
jgi:abortive infection bacteriophage resistance protein